MSVRSSRSGGVVTKKAEELRGLEMDELQSRLREAKDELFKLRFQFASGQLENHGRLRAVRRDIARIYTVMREMELGITVKEEKTEGAA
ncbi:MAG: 50S ribosomal protein L29 [Acidothermus sp.]|nr:50S ribosomal protein L29 [Acidothermus sp.]MCL6538180.1 50S ribosomal protein L29 [Acidothermus sp.]